MEAKRLQRWWIAACVVALLLATWVGGFSLVATFIFGVIYLTGATMIGRGDGADEAEEAEETDGTEAQGLEADDAEAET